jgi:response regulator of citrate/malate metabolism
MEQGKRITMRKDPLEIIEAMFRALETGRPFSINELAKETGMHNITVKKYIRIIQTIRREPRVEVIKTRHSIILRVRRQ